MLIALLCLAFATTASAEDAAEEAAWDDSPVQEESEQEAVAPEAAADATGPAAESSRERPGHIFSATFGPILLFIPALELNGEYRVLDKLGVAGILGYASMATDLEGDPRVKQFQLGTQANYYVLGDFDHGLHLGAHLEGRRATLNTDDATAAANAFLVGGLAGYKVAASFGLTFMLQAGYAFAFVSATGSDTAGQVQISQDDSDGLVLLRINLGWSF